MVISEESCDGRDAVLVFFRLDVVSQEVRIL